MFFETHPDKHLASCKAAAIAVLSDITLVGLSIFTLVWHCIYKPTEEILFNQIEMRPWLRSPQICVVYISVISSCLSTARNCTGSMGLSAEPHI